MQIFSFICIVWIYFEKLQFKMLVVLGQFKMLVILMDTKIISSHDFEALLMSQVYQVQVQVLGKFQENSFRPTKEKARKVLVKKPTTLLNIYYFTIFFKEFRWVLSNSLFLFIKTGFILSVICCWISLQSKGRNKDLFGEKTLNHLFHMCHYNFSHKNTVEEGDAPSLPPKEKRGSAKS